MGLTGFDELNDAQREAAQYGIQRPASPSEAGTPGPLLIVAGAGSGKTMTLAHRVAQLVIAGTDPARILMLTFTCRAAVEMTRRAQSIIARARATGQEGGLVPDSAASRRMPWAGTFHSIANRLLRLHARAIGLDPSFTILDRADSADLLDLVRNELGLAVRKTRFPKKATCQAIYSHVVNAQVPLQESLAELFPWCECWAAELRELFAAYTEAKQARNVVDYDDLLSMWSHMMTSPEVAGAIGSRFDHVLVDEYQDTNRLQAAILLALRPNGHGVTVVGDDAQSIYAFRGATVRNILEFPASFSPPAKIVTLERNYRSTQPILDACNRVIGAAREGYTKRLHGERRSRQRPFLVTVADEADQAEYVVERILEQREAGALLREQAVLFRTAHHSDLLEVELGRRDIPFVKYGGLRFLEAAHVKDVLCVLRWAENLRDEVAGFRVLQLLPGMGPVGARRVLASLRASGFDPAALLSVRVATASASEWGPLCELVRRLHDVATAWPGQVALVRAWYGPHLERIYDAAHVRAGDLEQLEQIAATHSSRERFLTDLTLDPPLATGDRSVAPLLDEDYLILSTIHSAKGQEWKSVYVLSVVDGCIPSDMATGKPEQVEEERRLLYVAMTRAKDDLHLIQPLRFFVREQHRYGDAHVYAPRSRFITDSMLDGFERRTSARSASMGDAAHGDTADSETVRIDVRARLRAMWS